MSSNIGLRRSAILIALIFLIADCSSAASSIPVIGDENLDDETKITHVEPILIWQAPIHVSKSTSPLHNSMHQAHAHHPWSMHVAPPKSWILRAAQDLGAFWRLKPSLNSISEIIWLTTKFHQISIVSSNFRMFMSMGQTCRHLWPKTIFRSWYLQHLKLQYEISDWKNENERERQTFEHRPKMLLFFYKKTSA